MLLNERTYRTLIVSSSDKFNESITPIISPSVCYPLVFADSISSAKRIMLEDQFDFVIINSPLPDESGSKFAIDVSSGKSTVCLMFIRSELYETVRSKVLPHGVFTIRKPSSAMAINSGLEFMASARERLKKLEKKTLSIEERMEEIRLINRAKWLLIENLSMTESEAHRHIEKQAMNTCVSKSEVAKQIIKTYL